MGKLGRRLGNAVGGILGSAAANTGVGKKAIEYGIGSKKAFTSLGRMGGEKLGSYLPFKNGGVVVVVKAPKKARKIKK